MPNPGRWQTFEDLSPDIALTEDGPMSMNKGKRSRTQTFGASWEIRGVATHFHLEREFTRLFIRAAEFLSRRSLEQSRVEGPLFTEIGLDHNGDRDAYPYQFWSAVPVIFIAL